MDSLRQVVNFAMSMTPSLPPQLESVKNNIISHPLMDRVSSDWKIVLMDLSTVIAVACVFLTFIQGTALACLAFTTLAVTSAISAFYMRHFVELGGLRETANNISQENTRLTLTNQQLAGNVVRLEGDVTRLNGDVTRLEGTISHLEINIERLETTNGQLEATNERLETNVGQLQTTNGELQANNERLETNIGQLQTTNGELQANNERLETNIGHLLTTNGELQANNVRLETNIGQLQTTNGELQATNSSFLSTNTALNLQVSSLNLQVLGLTEERGKLATEVTVLKESAIQLKVNAEKIRDEVRGLEGQSDHLKKSINTSVESIKMQIENSTTFLGEISKRLDNQEQGLGEKLTMLTQYLGTLKVEGLNESMKMNKELQLEIKKSTEELTNIRILVAQESTKLTTITNQMAVEQQKMEQLQTKFDGTIDNANTKLQSAISDASSRLNESTQQFVQNNVRYGQNNQQLQAIVTALTPPTTPHKAPENRQFQDPNTLLGDTPRQLFT